MIIKDKVKKAFRAGLASLVLAGGVGVSGCASQPVQKPVQIKEEYRPFVTYDEKGNAYFSCMPGRERGLKIEGYTEDGIPLVRRPKKAMGLKEHGDFRDALFRFFAR